MQFISAKEELKCLYNIEMTPKQKLLILEEYIKDYDFYKLDITCRNQRIPRLAIKQVLDECLEILKVYYSVNEILGGGNI